MALIGEHALSMRLVSAYVGLLAIPLVYTLGKTLLGRITANAVWIGVVAAAALSASYWHISLSRLGFRTILLPLFVMLALLWFWQGWQQGQLRWFGLAGLAIGMSQYTYLAARAVPILFIALVAVSLCALFFRHVIESRRNSDPKSLANSNVTVQSPRGAKLPEDYVQFLKGVVLMGVIALLIYLPLGIYLLSTPSDISARTEDVSLLGQTTASGQSVERALIDNVILVGRMFVDSGDTNLRHNLPGRAALDWFNVIGFVTGLGLLLWHWRKPQSWLLAIWLVVMLLPTLLATAAPHYLRASGAVGAVMIIVGIGLVWWWDRLVGWLVNVKGGKWEKLSLHIWLLLPVLVLLISTTVTVVDYFGRWANYPKLYDHFQAVELEAANAALKKLREGTVYLIPDIPAQRSPVIQLLLNFSEVRPVASECLVFQPHALEPVTYLVRTYWDEETLPQLQVLQPGGVVETAVFQPDSGEVLFETYTVYPEEGVVAVPETVVAQFGDAIQLTYQEVGLAQDALNITATWQAMKAPTADHTLFIHLYHQGEEEGAPLAQLDIQACYPTGKWHPGEALRETYTLSLPTDLPPGEYTVALGWYTWPTFERLTLVNSDKPMSNQRHELGQITIDD